MSWPISQKGKPSRRSYGMYHGVQNIIEFKDINEDEQAKYFGANDRCNTHGNFQCWSCLEEIYNDRQQ